MAIESYHSCKMMYPTPDDLAAKVNEYFESCNIKVGRYTLRTPTMSGLARYLGFSSRAQMLGYRNDVNPLYEDIINDARLRVEEYLEGQLVHSKSPSGIIFSLKNNAGWVDKIEKPKEETKDEPQMAIAWLDQDPIPVTAVNPTPLGVGEAKRKGTVDDDDNND